MSSEYSPHLEAYLSRYGPLLGPHLRIVAGVAHKDGIEMTKAQCAKEIRELRKQVVSLTIERDKLSERNEDLEDKLNKLHVLLNELENSLGLGTTRLGTVYSYNKFCEAIKKEIVTVRQQLERSKAKTYIEARKSPPEKVKVLIFNTYFSEECREAGPRCPTCEEERIDWDTCHYGHIIAHSLGGPSVPGNYIPLCELCNKKSGKANPRDWAMKMFQRKVRFNGLQQKFLDEWFGKNPLFLNNLFIQHPELLEEYLESRPEFLTRWLDSHPEFLARFLKKNRVSY